MEMASSRCARPGKILLAWGVVLQAPVLE